MSKHEDKRFKDLMKMAGPQKPAPDFTTLVMNAIDADLQKEASLKLLLQQQPEDGPSFDFTAGVMAHISANKKGSVYKPIIPQKVWYGIAALLSVFAGAILLANPSHQTSNHQSVIAQVLKPLSSLSPIYLIVILLSVGLLWIDFMITKPTAKRI